MAEKGCLMCINLKVTIYLFPCTEGRFTKPMNNQGGIMVNIAASLTWKLGLFFAFANYFPIGNLVLCHNCAQYVGTR